MAHSDSRVVSFRLSDLPFEIQDIILELAFADTFKPTVLSLALCKGPGKQITLGHQYQLIEQTEMIRMLLSSCTRTRALVFRHKPHTLSFATRNTANRLKVAATGRKSYPEGGMFSYTRPGTIVFNAELDMIFIDSNYPRKLLLNNRSDLPKQVSLLPDSGVGQVQKLHLQATRNKFLDSKDGNEPWNSLVQACTSMEQLHVSSPKPIDAVYRVHTDPDLCYRLPTDEYFTTMYFGTPDDLDATYEPRVWFSSILYRFASHLETWMKNLAPRYVPQGCEITPAYRIKCENGSPIIDVRDRY